MTVLDEAPGEPTDARGRVAELHEIRARALAGPSEKATEAQHAKGKLTGRERIDLLLDPGSFRGRAAAPAPGRGLRPGGQEAVHGRCHHRLGHGRGPHGLRLRARLPDLRRRAGRGPRHEDPQDHGHGHRGRCAAGLAERRCGRPYPGGRLRARRLRRHLPAQHQGVGRHPADQRDARPVRGRRGLQPRPDGLRVHGPRDLADVHHRPGRGQGGDRRGDHPERPGRRGRARRDERRLPLRLRRRGDLPRRGPLPPVDAPAEQPREPAPRGVRATPADRRSDILLDLVPATATGRTT
jgi:hypothetical protein